MNNRAESVLQLKSDLRRWILRIFISTITSLYSFIWFGMEAFDGKIEIALLAFVIFCFSTFVITLSFVALLPKRMTLSLTADGLTFATPWRRCFHTWHSISEFGSNDKKVWFLLNNNQSRKHFFFTNYGKTPIQLRTLLERWKGRNEQWESRDAPDIIIACSDGGLLPVVLQTSWGTVLVGFKKMEDGERYFNTLGQFALLKPLATAFCANPAAFSVSLRLLYLNTTDAVDFLLKNPDQFPYEEFFIPFPESVLRLPPHQTVPTSGTTNVG